MDDDYPLLKCVECGDLVAADRVYDGVCEWCWDEHADELQGTGFQW